VGKQAHLRRRSGVSAKVEKISLGLQSLNSEAYNYVKIPYFKTLGDALNYVRERTG
jgi:hypothetical protein